MNEIWVIVLTAAATVAVCIVVAILKRRRRTPPLRFDLDAFPDVEHLMPTIAGLTGGAVFKGNAAQVLQNDELFPILLEDIARAERSVHLETFVWTRGEVERQFIEALSAKAQQGVEVRVLLDALGSFSASSKRLAVLQRHGVKLALYCPPWPWNWRRLNHRTHRKLLVVDGRIGYTFGHGIADQWLGRGQDPQHWRDTAIRLQGPVVHALQAVFAENWIEETSELLVGDACFPLLEPAGETKAHVVSSSCGDALSAVAMLYTIALASARREVLIQNPYFVPSQEVIDLLGQLVKHGVSVKLMIPGRQTDSPFVRRASCHLYGALLRAGVRVYEYQRTLIHQKIMVVDELWSHVGSTNFDARSLELNEEISVGVLDAGIAAQLKAAFQDDLRHCRELTLERWAARPRRAQLIDACAYLAHSQL